MESEDRLIANIAGAVALVLIMLIGSCSHMDIEKKRMYTTNNYTQERVPESTITYWVKAESTIERSVFTTLVADLKKVIKTTNSNIGALNIRIQELEEAYNVE